MDTRATMQGYYASRAREYDEVYSKPERQADLRAVEAWVTSQFSGRRVLEVACGTGYWTRFIARVATSVVAIDAAPETLEIARGRAPDNVSFVVDDAYGLQHVCGPFDAAFAGFWFSHVPIARRRAFLDRLSRVLESRSTVVLLDNRFVAGSNTPISGADPAGDTFQLRRLNDGSTFEVLKNFPEEPELLELAAEFGEGARVTQWRYFWALQYETRSSRHAACSPSPGLSS